MHAFYAQALYSEGQTELYLIYQKGGEIQSVDKRLYEVLVEPSNIDDKLKDGFGIRRIDGWEFAFTRDADGNLVNSNLCPVEYIDPARFMVIDYGAALDYKRRVSDKLD